MTKAAAARCLIVTSRIVVALIFAGLLPGTIHARQVDSSRSQRDSTPTDTDLKRLARDLEEARARAQEELENVQRRVDSTSAVLREQIERSAASGSRAQAVSRSLLNALDSRLRALEARDSVARDRARDDRLRRLIAGERLAQRLRDDGQLLATTADAIKLSAGITELANPFKYPEFDALRDSLLTTFDRVQRPLLLGLVDQVRASYEAQPVAAALDPLVTLLIGPRADKKKQESIQRWQREFLCVSTAAKALANQQLALTTLTSTLRSRAHELQLAADSSLSSFYSATGYEKPAQSRIGYEAYLRELARSSRSDLDFSRAEFALFSVGIAASKFQEVSHAASEFLDGYRQSLDNAQALGDRCSAIKGSLASRLPSVEQALKTLERNLAPAIRDGADPSAVTRAQLLSALQAR